MPTPGIDFFRVDRTAPTRRVLVFAAALILMGMTGIGAHLVHRIPIETAHFVTLLGGLATAAGLVLGFGSMLMMLFENVYLAIEVQGILIHDNGKETKIAWDELAGVEAEPRGFVALKRSEGEPVRFHAGGDSKRLVSQVEDAKRKASLGILKIDSTRPPPTRDRS
jgi:hypothetical protein